jgi:hypothetical protein
MNTSALVMMFASMITITVITTYFILKVLKTPPKPEPDSYQFNDDELR